MEGGRIEIQHAAALQNANTVRLNAVVTLYRHTSPLLHVPHYYYSCWVAASPDYLPALLRDTLAGPTPSHTHSSTLKYQPMLTI